MYTKGKRNNKIINPINRNLIYPVLNTLHANHEATTSIEIVELNSDGDEINVERRSSVNECSLDTNNDFLKNDYETNRSEREKIVEEAEQYYNYLCNETVKYKSNLRDIFTDIYSEVCYDISDNNFANNIKYCKATDKVISSSSSEGSENYNYCKYGKDWCNPRNVFDSRLQNNADYSIEYYFSKFNDDISNSTSPSSLDEDEQVDKITDNRIATPVPTTIPKLNIPKSKLPTVIEVAEPKPIVTNVTPSNNDINEIKKHNNSWLNDSRVKSQPERYFSWIPLIMKDKKNLSATHKLECKNKSVKKQSSCNSNNNNKLNSEQCQNIMIRSSDIKIFDKDSTKHVNKLHANEMSKELDIITNFNNNNDSLEETNCDVNANLELKSIFTNDNCEVSLSNTSPTNKSASLHSMIKTNSVSIPPLQLSTSSMDERRPWTLKILNYICCKG